MWAISYGSSMIAFAGRHSMYNITYCHLCISKQATYASFYCSLCMKHPKPMKSCVSLEPAMNGKCLLLSQSVKNKLIMGVCDSVCSGIIPRLAGGLHQMCLHYQKNIVSKSVRKELWS